MKTLILLLLSVCCFAQPSDKEILEHTIAIPGVGDPLYRVSEPELSYPSACIRLYKDGTVMKVLLMKCTTWILVVRKDKIDYLNSFYNDTILGVMSEDFKMLKLSPDEYQIIDCDKPEKEYEQFKRFYERYLKEKYPSHPFGFPKIDPNTDPLFIMPPNQRPFTQPVKTKP